MSSLIMRFHSRKRLISHINQILELDDGIDDDININGDNSFYLL